MLGNTSNRTILELKYFIGISEGNLYKPSNRTILELKLLCDVVYPEYVELLIVPFWN